MANKNVPVTVEFNTEVEGKLTIPKEIYDMVAENPQYFSLQPSVAVEAGGKQTLIGFSLVSSKERANRNVTAN